VFSIVWFLKTSQVTHKNQQGSSGDPDFNEDVRMLIPMFDTGRSTTNAKTQTQFADSQRP
jgi:hypothetical protein